MSNQDTNRQVELLTRRLVQQFNNVDAVLPVNVKSVGIIGNGTGDDTAALQALLSSSDVNEVLFTPGVYNVSAPISIADNITVRFDKRAKINVIADFQPNFVSGSDARYVFLPGTNCTIDGANIDVQHHAAGGICIIRQSNVLVKNSTVENWSGVFGIADIAASQVWYAQNTVRNGVHGLHSYKSRNVTMSENTVDIMSGGGIYTAWCYRVSIVGNIVSNIRDVGVDFEGGSMCTSFGNTVERCKNGELALYSGNGEDNTVVHHLIHRGNTVHRRATFVVGYDVSGNEVTAPVDQTFGACSFHSIADGCYEVGFEQNTVTVDSGAGPGLYHYQTANTTEKRVFFTRNTVTSAGSFFRILNSVNFRFTSNEFYGRAGSETTENEFRDAHAAIIRKNLFSYDNPKTAGFALLLNTNTINPDGSAWATKPAHIGWNQFVNAPGLAIKVDLFRNGSLQPTLRSNDLGDTYTPTGGLSITSNGNTILKEQRLKLLMSETSNDYTAVTGLSRSGLSKANGFIGYGRQGYNGSSAMVQYVNGTGWFILPGVAAAGLEIKHNQNGPILNNTTDTACTGTMDLEVNTY